MILKSFTRLGHLPEDTGALDHSKGKVQRWRLHPWLVFQLSPKCVLNWMPALQAEFFFLFTYFLNNLFNSLFLVALHLHCCTQAFSRCGKQGLLFVAVRGLLIAVASLVAEHRL